MISKIWEDKASRLGLYILLLVISFSLFGPLFYIYSPFQSDVDSIYQRPSLLHPFGTDSLGRDVLARILYGGRVSLSVGFLAVGVSLAIGLFFGTLAGFWGGFVDSAISRFIDIVLSFPTIFLIIGLGSIFEPSLKIIILIIGLTLWPSTARLVRAEILSLKEREFILASRLLGSSSFYIITKHLIPNALGPVVVNTTLNVGLCILIEAGLSFLGLGVQPPTPSWGNILMQAKESLSICWWLTFFPGLFIFLTVLGANLLGDALRRFYRG